MEQLSKAVKKWIGDESNQLVIVLGTGSYGHPIAKKFNLEKGLPKKKDVYGRWQGAIETRLSVLQLLVDVSNILAEQKVPVFPVSPATIYRDGILELGAIKKVIQNGLIPVLHGDMVFDAGDNTLIYSGDNIAIDVAKGLEADEVHFVTKGDGIFFDGEHVSSIRARQLADKLIAKSKEKHGTDYIDVSEGFFGKLGACLEYVPSKGIRIYDGEDMDNFKNGFVKNKGGSLIMGTFN